MIAALEWQFGGALRQWPVPVAWSTLGVLGVGGVALVWWSYRRTLRALPPGPRATLTILRTAILLGILLCLADPARVERRPPERAARDTLAVVVDRSDSMTAPDPRGATRLAGAARLWKGHEAEAARAFPRVVYRRFALTAAAAPDLDAALRAGDAPGPETHLLDALRQALDATPGAVVCLTDGLDTTGADAGALAAEAQRRGVPLFFAPGTNRARPTETLNVREVKAPARVLRQTQFTASALLEVAAPRDGDLPAELWSGGQRLAAARLPVRAGLNTFPWPVEVSAGEAGPMPLEFRVGAGERQQVAACTTQVVDRAQVEVLYYQGALQWGYRYLLAALESDPSFRVTSILNPSLGVRLSVGAPGHAILPDLPDDARGLRRFQIVVLAHVFADRLTEPQTRALVEYARGGGGVLFIAPGTEATARFAGTALEAMLPVAFEPAGTAGNGDDLARRFREQMAGADANDGNDALLATQDRRQILPRLQPFALPPGASRSATAALFQNATAATMPRFYEYARVRALKPGADALAVAAPTRPGASEPLRVLLARQAFGAGFTAALTTDLLWRWKMSLPSDSRAAETFWQQLLLSLAPPPGGGLRLVKLTAAPAVRAPVALRVEAPSAAGAAPPVVEVISPAGTRQPVALHAAADGQEGAGWEGSFVPDAAGRWEARTTDAGQGLARIVFPVAERARTAESLDVPPNIEAMRQLAQSTGGALIGDEPLFEPRVADSADAAPVRRTQPLWHSGWLLGGLLGLYGAELVARRYFRLL